MTTFWRAGSWPGIIPYQELLGNYDHSPLSLAMYRIIPYQELLGNYDLSAYFYPPRLIIPYQELLGNYDGLYVG